MYARDMNIYDAENQVHRFNLWMYLLTEQTHQLVEKRLKC